MTETEKGKKKGQRDRGEELDVAFKRWVDEDTSY